MKTKWLVWTLLLTLLGLPQLKANEHRDIWNTVQNMASASPWPGFDIKKYPLAIFVDNETMLFAHPNPPQDFIPVPGESGIWKYPGLWPELKANTVAEIGGIPTATIMIHDQDATKHTRQEWAAIAIHEMFHAFANHQFPNWQNNEMAVFNYPKTSVEQFIRCNQGAPGPGKRLDHRQPANHGLMGGNLLEHPLSTVQESVNRTQQLRASE